MYDDSSKKRLRKRRSALLPIGCLLNTVYSEKGAVTTFVSQLLS
ncbi:hypothetical protein HMPREF1379_01140 [Enterococcus faecium R497]|nr:hypothetical protein HMPREF1379_01140 [Enterococcus faecium R497]